VSAIVITRVIPAAIRIILDLKPQMDMATIRDMRRVNMMKRGRACLLKKSVQQAITSVMAINETDTTITTAVFMKIYWNLGLL
jgi:hypothetical protein